MALITWHVLIGQRRVAQCLRRSVGFEVSSIVFIFRVSHFQYQDSRRMLLWNRAIRDFDAVAGSGKKGVIASIRAILKLRQNPKSSCGSKVTRDTKEFYFEEFKVN
ncbi:uncharacterized protein LOC130807554 [Amaranthus tricolor]|uniref:uncharacterized protein LOC130807554 n=1 Tax=Amaranthus tricolor TaxID=29722 RepID=UPI002589991F|nr:uncharacterized protein LOC130807554 [Amaranthus tricolor]